MEQPLLYKKIGIQTLFNPLPILELLALISTLPAFGIWYAHTMIVAYLITAAIDPTICYADRGWTHFERSCSELIKPFKAGGQSAMWEMTIETTKAGGRQPGRQPGMQPVRDQGLEVRSSRAKFAKL